MREREIAVRLALGATRGRLARDLVLESMLLGLAGGIAGALLALPVLYLVQAYVPWSALRAIGELRLDPEILAVAFGASLLAGVAFGLVPALRLPDAGALREGARSSAAPSRLRDGLVVAEIALAASLLATSGPVLRGAQHLLHASRGFDASSVLTAQLWIPPERRPEPRQVVDLVQSAVDKIASIPGVERASAVNFPPGSTSGLVVPFAIPGAEPAREEPRAVLWVVLPGYFETLRIPLLAGRAFAGSERASAAVVSASFARAAWPGLDPIGRTLEPKLLKTRAFWVPESAPQTLTVVGVAADVREEGLSLAGLPQIYLPLSHSPARLMHLLVRARGDVRALARDVARAVAEVDPAQPVFDVKTLDEVLAASFTQPRFAAALLSAFAGLALLLSALGTYAVMALSVAQRRREIGVRIALGAGTGNVAALVLGKGIRLTLLGLVLGLPGGYALTRALASFVEGVEAFDVEIYLGIAGLLGLAALLACALPAMRAARVPPAIALQAE